MKRAGAFSVMEKKTNLALGSTWHKNAQKKEKKEKQKKKKEKKTHFQVLTKHVFVDK